VSEREATESARAGGRATARAHAWRELTLLGTVYLLYTQTRLLAGGSHTQAIANARAVLSTERGFGLAQERWLNHALSARQYLAIPADYAYASLHYVVTLGVVIWLWRAHPRAYLVSRRTLVAATLIALLGYWLLPLAPPRMLPGFVDTMAQYGKYGWWGDSASAPKGLGAFTNQLAAMPSLHVGWAIWCGWQLGRDARHRISRAFGVIYPLVTVVVVIGTGNHYFADAVAGLVVVLVGAALTRFASLLWRRFHGAHPKPHGAVPVVATALSTRRASSAGRTDQPTLTVPAQETRLPAVL
jgi:hypothetical protein